MLIINKVDGQLGIKTTNAKLYIEQPPADFRIEHKDSKLIMHTEQVQILIDQSACFSEEGLKSNMELLEQAKEMGRQALMEGIARRAQEGRRMGNVGKNANAIAEIAFENSFDNHEFGLATIPMSRPKFDVKGGTVDIQVDEGYVRIYASPNKPKIEVEPGKVEIYMIQYPQISFEYTGNSVDEKV